MGSKILVADDEPHIRAVVRAYLEREGYEVLEAEDGETALEHGRNAGHGAMSLPPGSSR